MSGRQASRTYGKCVVQKQISSGGMGSVYLGTHQSLGIPVAVKVLPEYLSLKDPMFAKRFEREARLTAMLRHPHIVNILDYGVEGNQHYLVMEYIDGPTCKEKVEAEKRLPWREAVQIVKQVAEGLCFAATKGVIHRDVNPANIMLDSDGRAHIADLGLAREVTGDPSKVALTQTGTSLGTPYYMSPEQIMDAKNVDMRSDIYSLGITLYHLVCGQVPYTGTAFEIMTKHMQSPLPPLRERVPELPESVSNVIKKMAAKKPENRYQDYDDLLKDFEALLRGEEVSAANFEHESMVAPTEDLDDVSAGVAETGVADAAVAKRAAEKTLIVHRPAPKSRRTLYIAAAVVAAIAAAILVVVMMGF